MIQLSTNDIQQAGGLLSALSVKSAQYIRSLLPPTNLSGIENIVRRHIVHTNPHLDDYFAELLFRASLPSTAFGVEFLEESLYSATNDLGAMQLWPEAVVFGIGGTVSYGVQPVLLFDEHAVNKGNVKLSCSEMVADYIQSELKFTLPKSIQTVLREVNAIDGFGGAHPQHLNNLIKTLHNVYFLFEKGVTSKYDVKDLLDCKWKRAVIDACLVAMIYAFSNNVDLFDNPEAKRVALQKSLNHYKANSLHKFHPQFEKAGSTISSNYGNQNKVFDQALLLGAGKTILKDSSGDQIPQLLILSRICYACNATWGDNLTNMLMMHFWETEFQKQIIFLSFRDELELISLISGSFEKRTSVGVIRCQVLQQIQIIEETFDKNTGQRRKINQKVPLWIFNIVPKCGEIAAKESVLNYINRYHHGCGIVLLEDPIFGTKTLFHANSIPPDKWANLVNAIKAIEPQCWYDRSSDPNNPAAFINNGNRTHQYVPRSALDLHSLCELVKKF